LPKTGFFLYYFTKILIFPLKWDIFFVKTGMVRNFGFGTASRNLILKKAGQQVRSLLLFFTALVISAVFCVSAAAADSDDWRTFPYNLGGGIDVNMNTREKWAQGFSVMMDRHINRYLVVGLRGILTNDYHGITVVDAGLLTRLYVFKLDSGGAFTQLGGGISFFQEEERRKTAFMLNYGAGYRWYFLKGFYAEGSVQAGYPFQWGISLTAGHWFNF
jgi:hypothetical protein